MFSTQQKNNLITFFPWVLFLVNFGIRIMFLTSEDIGLDEPFSIYHAQFPVSVIIDHLKGYNNPPLYEIILHYWTKVIGIDPFSVRLLPMIFACLAPIALFFFAKKNFSIFIAFSSSLLLTFSSLMMYYAHDCRVYSLFTLLTVLSVHFFMDAVERKQNRRLKTAAFIIFSTLLIYAHYFGFFVILLQAFFLLCFKRKSMIKFIGYYFIVLILYLPHLYPFLLRMGDSVSKGTWIDPPTVESLYNALWAFSNFPFVTVACIVLLVATLIKITIRRTLHQNYPLVVFITFWFLFVYLGMFVISFWVPMYIPRYLIFGLPAYYILLGLCLEYLIVNSLYRHLTMLALIICFITTLDYHPDKKQPMAKVVEIIKNHKRPETSVLIYSHDVMTNFSYYYDRKIFSSIDGKNEYKVLDSLLAADRVFSFQSPEELENNKQTLRDEVLYYAAGEHRINSTSPVYQWLSNNLQLEWKKKTGPNWYVLKFKSAN